MRIIWRIKMKLQEIITEDIKPNEWNPNEMTDNTFNHLKKEYERVGYLQPVLVRPIKKGYEIIDGYHRWAAAKDLNHDKVACIVVEMDDETAKITTLNMNAIKGENNPIKYAKLIADLKNNIELEQLIEYLNTTENEITQYINLLDLPDLTDEDFEPDEKEIEDYVQKITCPLCNGTFKATDV